MTYVLDDDPQRVDLDVVWAYLSEHAYWGRWRTRQDVEAQVAGAWRVIGCYDDAGMVGFARALSDGIGLAYLADVFVLPDHRGQGLGKRIVVEMIDGGTGSGFRWMLHTRDANGLYEQLGFAPPDATYLERPHGS
jgi:GNAT superfamily N-acetyltransferase